MNKSVIKTILVLNIIVSIYIISCTKHASSPELGKLDAVSGIELANVGDSGVRLSWGFVGELAVEKFLVEYRTLSDEEAVEFAGKTGVGSGNFGNDYAGLDWMGADSMEVMVVGEDTIFSTNISGLSPNTTNVFRIKAVQEGFEASYAYYAKGYSDWSSVVSISYEDIVVDLNAAVSGTPTLNPVGATGIFSFTNAVEGDITIDPSTGAITGTGTMGGVYTVGIRFEGSGDYIGVIETILTITVNPVEFVSITDTGLANINDNGVRLSWGFVGELTVEKFLVEYRTLSDEEAVEFAGKTGVGSGNFSNDYAGLDWIGAGSVEVMVVGEDTTFSTDISTLSPNTTNVFRIKAIRGDSETSYAYYAKGYSDWSSVASISYEDIVVDLNAAISGTPTIDPVGATGIFSFTNAVGGDIAIDPSTGAVTGTTGTETGKTMAGVYTVGIRFEGSGDYIGVIETILTITVNPIQLELSQMNLNRNQATVILGVSQYSIADNTTNNLISFTGPPEAEIAYTIEPVTNKDFNGISIDASGSVSATVTNIGKVEYKITATASGNYAGSVSTNISIDSKLVILGNKMVIPDYQPRDNFIFASGGASEFFPSALLEEQNLLPDDDPSKNIVMTNDFNYYLYRNTLRDTNAVNYTVTHNSSNTIRFGIDGNSGGIIYFMVINKNMFLDNTVNLDITVKNLHSTNPNAQDPQMGLGVLTTTGMQTVFKGKALADTTEKDVTFSSISKEADYHLAFEVITYSSRQVELDGLEIIAK